MFEKILAILHELWYTLITVICPSPYEDARPLLVTVAFGNGHFFMRFFCSS
jgi:hypothetical protein